MQDRREFASAFVILAAGMFVIGYAHSYLSVGTLRMMGPGFFPLILGYILIGLGLIIGVSIDRGEAKTAALDWRAAICVIASVGIFALTLRPLGLLPSCTLLIVTASFGSKRFSLRTALAVSVFVGILSYLIFTVLFAVPLNLIRGVI